MHLRSERMLGRASRYRPWAATTWSEWTFLASQRSLRDDRASGARAPMAFWRLGSRLGAGERGAQSLPGKQRATATRRQQPHRCDRVQPFGERARGVSEGALEPIREFERPSDRPPWESLLEQRRRGCDDGAPAPTRGSVAHDTVLEPQLDFDVVAAQWIRSLARDRGAGERRPRGPGAGERQESFVVEAQRSSASTRVALLVTPSRSTRTRRSQVPRITNSSLAT